MPTILIVDSDKLVRWSLSRILARAGYRVEEASSGAEALAAARGCRPDLVLLDIFLPDRNGFTVLEAIRSVQPNLPVVMITAEPGPDTKQHALQLGACGHLEKPCDSSELLTAVSEALHSASPPRTSDR